MPSAPKPASQPTMNENAPGRFAHIRTLSQKPPRKSGIPNGATPEEWAAIENRQERWSAENLFYTRCYAVVPVPTVVSDMQFADQALLAFRKYEPQGDFVVQYVMKRTPELQVILTQQQVDDTLTRSLTQFSSFEDMLSASEYPPPFREVEPSHIYLADRYDQEQERRGSCRKAFRHLSLSDEEILDRLRMRLLLRRFRPSKKIACVALALCLFASPSYAGNLVSAKHLACYRFAISHGPSLWFGQLSRPFEILERVDFCVSDSKTVCFQSVMKEDGLLHPVEVSCCEDGKPFCTKNSSQK